jgi:hypothetical protein
METVTTKDGEYTVRRNGKVAEIEHRSGYKMRINSARGRPSHDEIARVKGDLTGLVKRATGQRFDGRSR